MARDDTDRDDDRGFFDRAADEARSWFADDDAERHRSRDQTNDRSDAGSDAGQRSREGYSSDRSSNEDRDRPSGDRRRDPRNYGDYDYDRQTRSSGHEPRGEDSDRALYAPTGSGMTDYGTNRGYDTDRGYDRTGDYSGGTYDRNDRSGSGYRSGNDYRSGGYGPGSDRGSGQQRTSHAGRGPQGYSRSPDRITEDVNEHLMDDHDVDATNVRVSVDDGEVTLEGTVRSRSEKRRAEDVAERVRGVRDVHNRLRVSDDASAGGDAETPGEQVNTVLGAGEASGTSRAQGSQAS